MHHPDFIFGLTPGLVSYDIETYPNTFTCTFLHQITRQIWRFEISDRRNDLQYFCDFIDILARLSCAGVGYNSIGFDYPVVHMIYQRKDTGITVAEIYEKAMSIIDAPWDNRFAHMVWESEHVFKQIDLYKLHHFDNSDKATSLKELEFKMGMSNIEDLPFAVGTHLSDEEKDILIKYNDHDVYATDLFLGYSLDIIETRRKLGEKFDTDMINCSDVKMGEKILVHEIEKAGLPCYEKVGGRRQKRQTQRDSIDLSAVIFPYVSFERPEFQAVLSHLKAKVITETKGVFNDVKAFVDGLDYKIGTGGLHASVESQTICSDDYCQIVDVDVASFYPNLAIKNHLYPAHLGEPFCQAYLDIYETRRSYPKSAPENGAFKLAMNGAFGGSNSKYSPFYDPAYTMAITINGQMLLCMLVEQLIKTPGLKMIQANTDGVTYLCPREYLEHTRAVCSWWEQLTKLELEEALYSRMFIRDVNNYIAEYEGGELKRIGAYAYTKVTDQPATRELTWSKNWSSPVVAKAAEAALVRGENIGWFIEKYADINDFMLVVKVPRSNRLEWGGEQVQNTSRYYISKDGKPLEKVMPPAGPEGAYKRAPRVPDSLYRQVLEEVGGAHDERIHTKNKSTYEERRTGINTGWKVTVCNRLPEHVLHPEDEADYMDQQSYFSGLNRDWYVAEAEKLVKSLTRRQTV